MRLIIALILIFLATCNVILLWRDKIWLNETSLLHSTDAFLYIHFKISQKWNCNICQLQKKLHRVTRTLVAFAEIPPDIQSFGIIRHEYVAIMGER